MPVGEFIAIGLPIALGVVMIGAGVVNFVGVLHTMGEPVEDVVGVVGVDLAHKLEERSGLIGIRVLTGITPLHGM